MSPSTFKWGNKLSHAIVVGNPIDGIQLIGPFASAEQAAEYAESYVRSEYWFTRLQEPSPDTESLKHTLIELLQRHDCLPGITFYDRSGWQSRGETLCTDADLTIAFEGGFYQLWNHTGTQEFYDRFNTLVSSLRYHWQQGYSWSLHFYQEK